MSQETEAHLETIAMFPLSMVLFPGDQLSLNVFEPRYQRLVIDCQAGSGEFGIVLISRGSEVGGGDQRFSVGTIARIEQASPYSHGRWFLLVRGVRRIRVHEWITEDPYPTARVEELPTLSWDQSGVSLDQVQTSIGRVLALLAELGNTTIPKRFENASDPLELLWQLAALAPFNAMDAQKVLGTDEPALRAELIASTADELYSDLRALRDNQQQS